MSFLPRKSIQSWWDDVLVLPGKTFIAIPPSAFGLVIVRERLKWVVELIRWEVAEPFHTLIPRK